MKTAITLRAEHEASELCESCHPGLRSGKEHGMHPLGDMKIPVPENLLYPGSPASGQKVACLVCHRAHGAREKILLAVSGGTNELCASCHAGLAPGLFGERERGKHARQPVLKAGQRQFAAGLRTRVGPSGELLCMTCHPAHKAASGRYLLAFDTAQPSSCSGCHSAQGLTVNSTHDLRAAHADARNVLGMTAREGGPCSGCHTAHRYGRAAAPGPLDPKGVCLTCHRAGEIAAATRLGAVNHPEKPCQDCHNPHEPGKGKYLRSSIRDLCLSCHKPMAGMQGGPHDVEQKPTAWPADAVASRDPCLACHRMHGNEQTGLYRMGFAPQAAKPDAACVACHADTAPNIGGDHALVHPGPVIKVTARADFPLAKSQTGSPLIACKTCHDPHRAPAAGDEAAVLLRAEPSESGRTMCLACHPQTAGIGSTGHSPDLLRQAGFATTACQPCHLAHAKPEAVEARVLYPSALLLEAKTSPLNLAADRFCVACHRPGGPVAPPTIATHKVVPMFNPTKPDQPGFLPLFNAEGETDPSGGISCRTCHVTHGRGEPAPLPEQVAGELTARESRARHYRLRSFGQSSVCNTCHGPDALWRFLYFHDPARRNPAPAQGSPGAFAPGGPVPRAP